MFFTVIFETMVTVELIVTIVYKIFVVRFSSHHVFFFSPFPQPLQKIMFHKIGSGIEIDKLMDGTCGEYTCEWESWKQGCC